MAECVIVYWRDIPAQIIVRAGRATARRELPPRFAAAIDQAAMRAGLTGTDAYLAAWRRAAPVPCGDDLDAEAVAAAEQLDAGYPAMRLRELVATLGQSRVQETDQFVAAGGHPAPPPDGVPAGSKELG